mmetsp:Transcript_23219/g.38177  ORF Transcript_23219/g.38177 Transcript_23219/m.38177 type:complete len:395 (+) Transcript_23219:154-1338(+)|eukprot:CAMPEP_0184648314 /NCGR_PEP_ID=MMETSP0308-20130426/5409_1 /TAXON_ID=38269 /ORGANISM="Gloeochaete witrockiana, Strain SAG 46.84" /LENGTH=394 /DNA_ID=CAMNT_0027080041 /DNA_START=84 /DNA_END=1268 /DNA_ORIENTATION=+
MALRTGKRILATDEPPIGAMQRIVGETLGPGASYFNMAQGQVWWMPPAEILKVVVEQYGGDVSIFSYGPCPGLPELRDAVKEKLRKENGLTDREVIITAGCNQAFFNVVAAVCDEGDEIVLFKPYYFDAKMAAQILGCTPVLGECNTDMTPNIHRIPFSPLTRAVCAISPNNPSGVVIPAEDLQAMADMCKARGIWFVCDETYELFTYEDAKHRSPQGPNVINLFSFSKAFGIAGWRVGYIAYPNTPEGQELGRALLKVQDTVPICASQIGQRIAHTCLTQLGSAWCHEHIAEVEPSRERVKQALGSLVYAGGKGALYYFVKLPEKWQDDWQFARWLIKNHRVLVVPGSAFGAPGYFRISFANLPPSVVDAAVKNLNMAVAELTSSSQPPWLET